MKKKKVFDEEERLVRLTEFLEELPICRSTWFEGVKKGIYPQPIRVSRRAVAWRLGDIKELIKKGVSIKKRSN